MNHNFSHLAVGEHRKPCPACSKKDTDKKCAVKVNRDGTGKWYCHSCGAAGGWGNDRQHTFGGSGGSTRTKGSTITSGGTTGSDHKPDKYLTLASHWRDLWNGLKPI